MLKKMAETVVGGALGLLALYAVGRLAYQAGQEAAREEARYQALRRASARMKETERAQTLPEESPKEASLAVIEPDPLSVPRKTQSRLGLLWGAGRMLKGGKSVLGRLVKHPEAHTLEAYVQGNELQIHVKPKGAL